MKRGRKLTQNTDLKKKKNSACPYCQYELLGRHNCKPLHQGRRTDDCIHEPSSIPLHSRGKNNNVWTRIPLKVECCLVYADQIKFTGSLFIILCCCILTFLKLLLSASSQSSILGRQKLRLQKWKYPHYANLGATDRHVLFYKLYPPVRSQNAFK